MPDLPPNDQLLASAIWFLIDGQEFDAASLLLSCSLSADIVDFDNHVGIELTGSRAAYTTFKDDKHPITKTVHEALSAVLPAFFHLCEVHVRGQLVTIDPSWRVELQEIARGRSVHNQAVEAANVVVWNNLRFRSESEKRIAAVLDRAGVLFFPNCMARLNTTEGRRNREPDFLICHEGRWGILEVDGPDFHPSAAKDHERDRLFRAHGVRLIEHFPANSCFETPDAVVKRFLELLAKS